MEPVTAADQPAVLDPEDADELIGTLRHAATVIGAVAGHPDARVALAGCPCGGGHDIEALWWNLQLAAGELTDATTAARPGQGTGKPARPECGRCPETPGHTENGQ
jgi:hypothetical protein